MLPRRLSFAETQHSNYSTYTLETVTYEDHDDHTPLLAPTPSYGAANFPHTPTRPSSRKVIINATIKMACIFAISSLILGGTLWLALPTLEEQVFLCLGGVSSADIDGILRADRPLLRIPKSFAQLQDLNGLLKKYRDIYPYRIIICYVVTYLLYGLLYHPT